MRWPFVRRTEAEAWERSSHAWARQTEQLLDLVREKDAQIERLMGQVLELKREGFMPPIRPEAMEPEIPDVPEVVLLAIGRRAPPKSELERELLRWAARELKQEDADPTAIARQILRGAVDPEED